jgi:hypothetical protein
MWIATSGFMKHLNLVCIKPAAARLTCFRLWPSETARFVTRPKVIA